MVVLFSHGVNNPAEKGWRNLFSDQQIFVLPPSYTQFFRESECFWEPFSYFQFLFFKPRGRFFSEE